MKFRRNAESAEGTREEVRELAEALSWFGSAMRHAAARQPERPWVPEAAPARAPRMRMRLVLAPALAAMLAVTAMIPMAGHFRHAEARKMAPVAQETCTETRASMNDTVLMNQIDSDVSQEVPDALEPLAELSEQAAVTKSSGSEQKNVTQE